MVAGQAGEAMTVAVFPVVGVRNPDTDHVVILHHRTTAVHALDILLRHQHAISSRVQVLCFGFLEVIYTFTHIK